LNKKYIDRINRIFQDSQDYFKKILFLILLILFNPVNPEKYIDRINRIFQDSQDYFKKILFLILLILFNPVNPVYFLTSS